MSSEMKIRYVDYQIYEQQCQYCDEMKRSSSKKALKHNLGLHEKKCKAIKERKENPRPPGRPIKNIKKKQYKEKKTETAGTSDETEAPEPRKKWQIQKPSWTIKEGEKE